MKQIKIFKPSSLDEALEILSGSGDRVCVYAGGTDIIFRLKNRLVSFSSDHLVDIKGIRELRSLQITQQGDLRIGSLVTLSELAESHLVARHFGVIREAINEIASPEVRNQATIGGDILQDVWCPYFRTNYPCWRNGGSICFAIPGDHSSYHSIMGGNLCYAAYPGDAAVALIALEAKVKIASKRGIKVVSLKDLLPGTVVADGRLQSNITLSDEIMTEVIVPKMKLGQRCSFEKIRQRLHWGFALVSLAIASEVRNGKMRNTKAIFGGVDVKPYEDTNLEEFLNGKKATPAIIKRASQFALQDAKPLIQNEYKVDIARGLVASGLHRILLTGPKR
jgi:xanthine dehydrogenase YagS FAD-binding subunit